MNKVFLGKPSTDPLRISHDECHVWKVDLRLVNKENFQISILSEDERKCLSLFKFSKDRFRYGITHSVKRLILASYLNEWPEKLVFTREKYGKPAILRQQNWLNLQFNLSHSHQLILLGVTVEDPVGIDVEYHDETISIESLSKFVFSPLEQQYFSTLTNEQERINSFFQCWTQKEAYLKAKGIGLGMNLAGISTETNKQSIHKWLKVSIANEQEMSIWHLLSLRAAEFYSASLVIANNEKTLLNHEVNNIEGNIYVAMA